MKILSRYYDKVSLYRFVIVGVSNTFIGYVSFAISYELTKLILISLVISTVLGVLNSFIWNSRWTFKGRYNKLKLGIIMKFVLLYAIITVINWALLKLAEVLKFNVIYAQIPSLLVTIIIGYTLQRIWVFKQG